VQRRLQQRIRALAIGSFELVRAERIRGALAGALRFARALVALALVFFYLGFVLGQFPWTRGAAQRLSGWVAGPLASMGRAVVAKIPDLIFLAILYLIVRWILRLMRLFFQAVAKREVAIAGFETEWADPTYKLLRLAVVAFAVVVAYPYIPGSASPAFKGISLFLGVVFSLGSSSTISNLIAGYTMTYRRAFRIGDMVKVGGMLGEVVEIRLQATHLRTPKNEEVILPNSSILTSEVVNYSSFAKQRGLILHTTVGIGYETPWRQVEAMLIQAAERTPGVLREPPPFVWQTALGDFAVTYQLNAYAQEALAMGRLYSALHRHILDVFNEYGVQIMTPAYEGDPEQPKVVPKEQWFTSPAAVPGPEPERGPDQ
jgi:small-conductance mechanosensitive channel